MNTTDAGLAQLFRALPCQGRGRELESLNPHHFFVVAFFTTYVKSVCAKIELVIREV